MGREWAALITPAALSIITNSFPDPRERAKAIGVWASIAGLGIVLGPAVGGWLLAHFWWGAVFLINVPIATAGIVGAYRLVPNVGHLVDDRLDDQPLRRVQRAAQRHGASSPGC